MLILIAFSILVATLICVVVNNKNKYIIISRVKQLESIKKKDQKRIKGWIKIEGTDIDYPVIQYNEDMENVDYLYVWKNTGDEKLENHFKIYGHNVLNVSSKPLIRNKDHTGFEQLAAFIYYSEAKNNQFVQYTVGGKDYLYKIYAVTFALDGDDGAYLKTKKEKKKYINKVKKKSLFRYNVDVNENDKLMSLITCTRRFGADYLYAQIIVDARLVRKNESIRHYKVKTSKDYDKLLGGKVK